MQIEKWKRKSMKRFWMLFIVAILIPLIALGSGLAGVRAEEFVGDNDDSKHVMGTIGSLPFTSSTTSVKAGVLPKFEVETTETVFNIEKYGSNTQWVKWDENKSMWRGFGDDIPTAFNDGSTHYGLRLLVEADDGYDISADAKVFFNGVNVAGNGHTQVKPMPWGAYVYIDLGLASGTNPVTHKVVFDSRGGSKVSDQTVPQGYCAKKPTPPTLADHYFWGWYLDKEYTQKYDFSTVLTSDITLYARWEETINLISEIRLTSNITYVKPGVLPTISAKTSTKHVQIKLDSSLTQWVYSYESENVVHFFEDELPVAVADGKTHYFMSVDLEVEDGYQLSSNVSLFFNGVCVSANDTGYILKSTFGGYARVDIGLAVDKSIDLDQVTGVKGELKDMGQNLFLSWHKVEDALDYEVWESCYDMKTGTTTDWKKIATTTYSSQYKMSLRPNIRYDYMIRAHRLDPYGEYFGKYSETYSFTPVSDIVYNLSSGKVVLDQDQTDAMMYLIFKDLVGYKPVNDSQSDYSMYVDLDNDGHYDVMVPKKAEDPLVMYAGRNLFDSYTISGSKLSNSSFSSLTFIFPKPTPTATPVPRDVKIDYTKGKVELFKLQRDALDLLVEKSLVNFRLDASRKVMFYDIDKDGNYDLKRNLSDNYSEMLNTCNIGGEFAFSVEQLSGSDFDSIVFVFPVQEISSVVLKIDAPALGKAPSYEVKIPDEADYAITNDVFTDKTNVKNGVAWLDKTTGKLVDVTKGVFEPKHEYEVLIGLSPFARYKFSSDVVVRINGKAAAKVELTEKGLIAHGAFAAIVPTNTPTPKPGDPTPKPGDPTPKPGDPTPKPGDPTPKPGDPTPKPGDPTPKPGDPTPKPGDPTPKPGEPTPDPEKGPSIADFVERLYTIALNRPSEPEGKAFWVNEIESGNRTGGDCAYFFLIEAPEFLNRGLNNEDFVETLYLTFFDRASEAAGKKFWVDSLKSGKMTKKDVIMGFIDSKEWCNVCADYGVKSGAPTAKAERASKNAINFATRLYTCCLGRAPEDGGLKYWSLALTNLEQTGCSAAKEFFTSDEFVSFKLKDDEYIRRLYTTFMGREPEASEVAYWEGEIKAGRQTRGSTLTFFGSSEEFTNICKKYGIDRGTI